MTIQMPVLFILSLLAAITSAALAFYHFFRMGQEANPRAEWLFNLVPWIAFGLPGAVSKVGGEHRRNAVRYLVIAVVSAAIAQSVMYFGDHS